MCLQRAVLLIASCAIRNEVIRTPYLRSCSSPGPGRILSSTRKFASLLKLRVRWQVQNFKSSSWKTLNLGGSYAIPVFVENEVNCRQTVRSKWLKDVRNTISLWNHWIHRVKCGGKIGIKFIRFAASQTRWTWECCMPIQRFNAVRQALNTVSCLTKQ